MTQILLLDQVKEKYHAIGRVMSVIDKKILKLREKLNSSIKNGASYDVIYKISVDLDEAIAEYYNCATNAKHFS